MLMSLTCTVYGANVNVATYCIHVPSHFQADKAATGVNSPYLCLSDFIAPAQSQVQDYIGMFAVSVGFGCEEMCEKSVYMHIHYALCDDFANYCF